MVPYRYPPVCPTKLAPYSPIQSFTLSCDKQKKATTIDWGWNFPPKSKTGVGYSFLGWCGCWWLLLFMNFNWRKTITLWRTYSTTREACRKFRMPGRKHFVDHRRLDVFTDPSIKPSVGLTNRPTEACGRRNIKTSTTFVDRYGLYRYVK